LPFPGLEPLSRFLPAQPTQIASSKYVPKSSTLGQSVRLQWYAVQAAFAAIHSAMPQRRRLTTPTLPAKLSATAAYAASFQIICGIDASPKTQLLRF
jgi:hypothetical protein